MTGLTIFLVFLRLGLTSFGGPIAHLGYFRQEFVERRRWLGETAYADLVALCQFLPGPASSQTGFAIGLMRGGWVGGLAAFLGFTLPSALLMTGAALAFGGTTEAVPLSLLHGLKLVAVAVVAQAVTGMARALTPDGPRAAIAIVAMAAMIWPGGALGQVGVIVLAAVVGAVVLRDRTQPAAARLPTVPVATGRVALGLLVVASLAAASVSLVWPGTRLALLAGIYRAGALVFGGGHVVLPMLADAVAGDGAVTTEQFLAGYGLAQAVPGPMFSLAAYLGAVVGKGDHGLLWASLATVAIFLPGLALVAAVLPHWGRLRTVPRLQRALDGVNAAVVGLLGATLYDPLWTAAVGDRWDVVIVAGGFAALVAGRMPALLVVVGTVAASGARVWI